MVKLQSKNPTLVSKGLFKYSGSALHCRFFFLVHPYLFGWISINSWAFLSPLTLIFKALSKILIQENAFC